MVNYDSKIYSTYAVSVFVYTCEYFQWQYLVFEKGSSTRIKFYDFKGLYIRNLMLNKIQD